MSSADPILAEAPDPAIARAEWCLTGLEELTQIGMKLARDLVQDAPEDTDATKGRTRIAEFARISRAVRLTITLVGRADETLRALQAGLPARIEALRTEAKERAERTTAARHKERGDLVTKLVLEAAERDVDDTMVVCAMEDAIDERLDWDQAYIFIEDPAPARRRQKSLSRPQAGSGLEPLGRGWLGAAEPLLPLTPLRDSET